MQILSGPNVHRRRSVVCLAIDPEASAPLTAPMLRQRADARLPAAAEWQPVRVAIDRLCSVERPVEWAEIVGALGAALQEERFDVTYRYRVEPVPGAWRIFIATDEGEVGGLAAAFAVAVAAALAVDDGVPAGTGLAARMRAFDAERTRVRLDWTTRVLVDAARAHGVPVMKPLPRQGLAVIGQGRWRQRCRGTSTDSGSYRAARIAKDKFLTAQLLAAAYVPVPQQCLVASQADLDAAVATIGFPLVVKGRTVDKGAAVTTGIGSKDELPGAIAKVRAQGDEVLVEKHVEGDDYRFTVVGGRLVAVATRTPASVVGDGVHSIRDLVAIENERRSGSGRFARWLEPLTLATDAAAMLARAGATAESVPAPGQVVRLSSAANMSVGGSSEDVTSEVCPALVRLAERVARIVGVDIAGIDIVTRDISRPLDETGGAVLEVNSAPGLRVHCVTRTPSPDVAGAIIDHLFPAPQRGRIPTVGVTGTNGKTTTCRMIARMLEQAGLVVGTTTTSGMTIGGHKVAAGDLAGGRQAMVILQDPVVEAAVLELARGGIVKSGLKIEDVDVGVVTNVTDDHVGQDGIATMAQLARVKRVVVEVARKAAVLNADDAHCRAMAPHLRAPIWWVSRAPGSALLAEHLAQGRNAVVIEPSGGGATIVHRQGASSVPVIEAAAIPAALGGMAEHNVENAAFAVAAGLALGLPVEQLRRALAGFENSFAMSPGRLNIHDADGVRIVYDYVHNSDGLRRIGELLGRMPVDGRRIAMLALNTKRPAPFYRDLCAVAAPRFDLFVVTELDKPGRWPRGEVTRMLRSGLLAAGVAPDAVHADERHAESIEIGLGLARPGDLVLIAGNDSDAEWARIKAYSFRG